MGFDARTAFGQQLHFRVPSTPWANDVCHRDLTCEIVAAHERVDVRMLLVEPLRGWTAIEFSQCALRVGSMSGTNNQECVTVLHVTLVVGDLFA